MCVCVCVYVHVGKTSDPLQHSCGMKDVWHSSGRQRNATAACIVPTSTNTQSSACVLYSVPVLIENSVISGSLV